LGQQAKDPHFLYLEGLRLAVLEFVYRVLIPLHTSGELFLLTRDPAVFRGQVFFDQDANTQASALEQRGLLKEGLSSFFNGSPFLNCSLCSSTTGHCFGSK
jgi:hypothetical protein